jgi:predicted metal-dependent phosphotriesterase family hydrolase
MGAIQTVTGPVSPEELGVTLPHEHLFIDRAKTNGPDAYLVDLNLAVQEVNLFKESGGSTIVDVTTREIARNPAFLREVAERTGIHIVMGTGHYRHPFLDVAWMNSHPVDSVAEELISDIQFGVDGSGIRSGIIGEIGSNGEHVSAIEERSFRAAARAHLATGVTITTHAALYPVGHEQLDILFHEGVAASRIIVGHCDTVHNADYHVALAQRGVFVQFDTLHLCYQVPYDLDLRVGFVMNMVRAGFERSVLLSHDVCLRSHLTALGGQGYSFLRNVFLPRLREAGLSEAQVESLVTDNPRRALSGES